MTSTMQGTSLAVGSLFVLALAGCALTPSETAATQLQAAGIHGRAFGGQQPVSGAAITVHAAGTSGYGSGDTVLAVTSTDVNGNFSFAPSAYTCPQANTPVYLTASQGNPGAGNNPSLMMAAGLGACSDAKNTFVQVNEVTTAATAYALAQFFTATMGAGSSDSFGGPSSTAAGVVTYSKGLTAANAYTIPTLVTLAQGAPNTTSSTSHVETTKLFTIADILAACVNSTGATSTTETDSSCGALFSATVTPGASTRPSDTLQAAVQMARYPYQNVTALLNLAPPNPPFAPTLTAVNDWTLGVSYTLQGMALNVTPGTSSNLDIDAAGHVWMPITSPAGVAMFDPTSNTFNGPFTQGGLQHPQNVAISNGGLIYLSDTGSGLLTAFNGNGASAGAFNTLGTSQSALAVGPQDQIWLAASGGTLGNRLFELQGGLLSGVQTNLLTGTTVNYATSMTVLPNNDVYSATYFNGNGFIEQFAASVALGPVPVVPNDVVVGNYGAVGAGQIARNGSSVLVSAPTTNTLCSLVLGCTTPGLAGASAPQGVVTDGSNNVWLANGGNASVSTTQGLSASFAPVSGVAYVHDANNGASMTAPMGIATDASGNVWVSNQTVTGGPYVLSELIGAAAPTITPLAAQIAGGVSLVGSMPTN